MTQPTDLDVALAAAAAGARVMRASYGGRLTGQAKLGLDFATNADLDAERAILEVIAAARPHDARVGEETGAHGVSGTRRWLVDPLCGTLNFAAQTPLVAVNVALVDGSDTLACASADPISDETFWADMQGAFVRRDGVDVPIHPSSQSRLVDVNCDGPGASPFLGPQLLGDAAFREAFGPRVVSTTLAVAWVAAGRRAATSVTGRSRTTCTSRPASGVGDIPNVSAALSVISQRRRSVCGCRHRALNPSGGQRHLTATW